MRWTLWTKSFIVKHEKLQYVIVEENKRPKKYNDFSRRTFFLGVFPQLRLACASGNRFVLVFAKLDRVNPLAALPRSASNSMDPPLTIPTYLYLSIYVNSENESLVGEKKRSL